MAIADIISRLLQPLFDRVKAALGPFGKLIDFFSHLFTTVKESYNTANELAAEIISEIHEWRDFKQNINVKNRVISVPKAIDQTQQLLDQIRSAWFAIQNLAKQVGEQLKGGTGETDPAGEAEEAIKDIQSGGLKDFFERFPKLAKAFEKVLGFLAIVLGALESIIAAINDLKQIVDAIKGIREEIETGSTVFLKNSNPRRIVHLDDGTTMKIRVGKLHS